MENSEKELGYELCAGQVIEKIDEQIYMICEHFKDGAYSVSEYEKIIQHLIIYRYIKGFIGGLVKQNKE